MEPTSAAERRRISLRGRSLRRHTGRGVLINTAFVVGINALSLVRGFVVAAFLTQAEYGVWGVVLITLSTVLVLKQAGISDRFVQQDDADERTAFQRAFTMEVLVTGAACVLFAAVVVPLVALVYGETRLLAPGFALVALLPALALQAPLWIYYRRMDFVRQRRLQAIDPVVGFVVTVALAVAGAGYWSLVLGMLAGAWAAAIASVAFAPHPCGWTSTGRRREPTSRSPGRSRSAR